MTDRLSDLAKRIGKKNTEKVLSALGKTQPFIDALSTTIGKEILNDAGVLAEEILIKIINLTATDIEKADYRAYINIMTVWASKIKNYQDNLSKFKG